MPISFTVIGSTLNATILDGNFDTLSKYLREGVVGADIADGTISRWVLKRYTGGRIVQARTNVNELLTSAEGFETRAFGWLDITYRYLDTTINPELQATREMELLGFPGPSWYWQYQEDGIIYGGAPDPNRYDVTSCYSYWLTIPGTSFKVFVPERGIAKVHGRAFFFAAYSAVAEYVKQNIATNGQDTWNANYTTAGDQIAMRIALVVDTNPVDAQDNTQFEFVNGNPNVIDPSTGAQSAKKSWSIVAEKSIHTPLWCREDISGEVLLEGGRWYNFSMKWRPATVQGFMRNGVTFEDGNFGGGPTAVSLPNYSGGSDQEMLHSNTCEVFWASTSLNVEFLYGYSAFYDDSSNIADIVP